MSMCTYFDCSNTELLSYGDTEPMTNSPTDRRTKGTYLWASTENSTIQTKTLYTTSTSIQVYLKIVYGEYVIVVSDSCSVHLKDSSSACKIKKMYISFGDQGSDDQFPSIKISYSGKFFYS